MLFDLRQERIPKILVIGFVFEEDKSCSLDLKNMESLIKFAYENFCDWFDLGESLKLHGIVILYFIILSIPLVYFAVQHHRLGKSKPTEMFNETSSKTKEDSIGNFIRFLMNSGFQSFGIEITSLTIFLLIVHRQDWISIGYAILLIFIVTRNEKSERVWMIAKPLVQISLAIQSFFMTIIIIFKSCGSHIETNEKLLQLLLYLSEHEPTIVKTPSLLIYEFFILIMITALLKEHIGLLGSTSWTSVNKSAQKSKMNFINRIKSYLFKYHFWSSLVMIFMMSSRNMDVFTFGYIAHVFKFLWHGSDFYMKPLKEIVSEWDGLRNYNISVMALKLIINVTTNEFFRDEIRVEKFKNLMNHFENFEDDFYIFILVLIQRRIFNCKYFLDVIFDTFITTNLLASRGAEMFEDLRLKSMRRRIVAERVNLEKFRRKMESIKEAAIFKNVPKHEPVSHESAIRCGGLFMFENDDHYDRLSMHNETENMKNLMEKNDIVYRYQKRVFDSQTALETFKEKIVEKSEFIRKYTFKLLLRLLKIMNKKSKTAGFIFRVLSQEKKRLRVECANLIEEM